MSLIKFNISWEEDNATFRDIEVLTAQSFYDLHVCIKQAFQFPENMEASFFMTDDRWQKEREISSVVEKNLRDAPALSMKKTPIGALMQDPHQKFVYVCNHPKAWVLLLEVISLLEDGKPTIVYPRITKNEGLSPSQIGLHHKEKDVVVETLELYDLQDRDGFGDEGEDEIADDHEVDDNNFTDDL